MEMDESAAEKHEDVVSQAGLVLAQAEISACGNKRVFALARKHKGTPYFELKIKIQ